MPITDQRTFASIRQPRIHIGRFLLRELVIWHEAWRGYQRLQRLDSCNLRDMGISRAQQESVTVGQIAARIRG